MAKHYLLLAAIPALMMAACSDDNVIDNGGANNPPAVNNSLNLKSLSASSQSGRVVAAPPTRGVKADRLQFVANIKPVAGVQGAFNWSATSIAFLNGKAYVTWHSNRQAADQATTWGGAIDVLDISKIETDLDNVIEGTYTSRYDSNLADDRNVDFVKFNNIVNIDGDLYVAGTGAKKGAVVARIDGGNVENNVLVSIPGSSANSVYKRKDGNLLAVSGYSGGAYILPADFTADTDAADYIEQSRDFGGKYVADGYVLRTDANKAALVDANAAIDATTLKPTSAPSERTLDEPLATNPKYGESFDNGSGEWAPNEGPQSSQYGKHTMTVHDGYVYVAAGANGLRVYNANSSSSEAEWSNGLFTTAVCSFEHTYNYKQADETIVEQTKPFIAAATELGLRIYRKFDATRPNGNDKMVLYAEEVDKYDADGNAASTTAHANGHSANFVAVHGDYIFVAYGQTGVNVYRLNKDLYSDLVIEEQCRLDIPAIGNVQTHKPENDKWTFTIPSDKPEAPEGKEFAGWSKTENADKADFQPEGKVEVNKGETVTLYPVWKDKGTEPTKHEVKFEDGNGNQIGDAQQVEEGNKPTAPEAPKAPEGQKFNGWKDGDGNVYPADQLPEINKPTTFVPDFVSYKYKFVFDVNRSSVENNLAPVYQDGATISIPYAPSGEKLIFKGWSTDKEADPMDEDTKLYQKGESFTTDVAAGAPAVVTLYGVWLTNAQGGGTVDPDEEPEDPGQGGGQGPDFGGATDE